MEKTTGADLHKRLVYVLFAVLLSGGSYAVISLNNKISNLANRHDALESRLDNTEEKVSVFKQELVQRQDVPLHKSNIAKPALISWAAQAATEVMTFGFHDYRARLQEASRHFTRKGWEGFVSALEKSRYIEMIEAEKQVISAAPRGAPIIKSEGIVNGRYQWLVQIPMVITFQTDSVTKTDKVLVALKIVRTPWRLGEKGIAISQWVQV